MDYQVDSSLPLLTTYSVLLTTNWIVPSNYLLLTICYLRLTSYYLLLTTYYLLLTTRRIAPSNAAVRMLATAAVTQEERPEVPLVMRGTLKRENFRTYRMVGCDESCEEGKHEGSGRGEGKGLTNKS